MIDRDPFMQRNVLIRLNNAAIDFLQRYQKHRLCIDTLKDGLTLMKTSPHDLSDSTTQSAREAWARAETRQLEALADPESSSSIAASDGTTEHGASTWSESPSASPLIVPNELGVVVLPSRYDPEEAYNLLATLRTSKVCLTLDPSDPTLDLAMVRSILVYNYGIAHRCCSAAGTAAAGAIVPQSPAHGGVPNNNKLESFCLQIFQYAETLLPPQIAEESEDKNHLLFRLVLTRNLMMLSCRLGLSLCEHYKETLDPIVADILGPIIQLDNQRSESNDRASAA
jgi:hypothetical protein